MIVRYACIISFIALFWRSRTIHSVRDTMYINCPSVINIERKIILTRYKLLSLVYPGSCCSYWLTDFCTFLSNQVISVKCLVLFHPYNIDYRLKSLDVNRAVSRKEASALFCLMTLTINTFIIHDDRILKN